MCFHCQQATEKILKALLQKNSIKFVKTHDLGELLRLALKKNPELIDLSEDLEWLTVFSVEFRYPGETATKQDAKEAYRILKRSWKRVYPLVKQKL